MASIISSSRDLGDFQTPVGLAGEVLDALRLTGAQWTRILEPTCGQGNFLLAAARSLKASQLFGIDIQPILVRQAESSLASTVIPWNLEVADIFRYDLRAIPWKTEGPLLVLGNPPWVTLSELSALNSSNVPDKVNIRGVRGILAMTGESNFDIAEYIWMRLLVELADQEPTIVLLCKTSVARRVLTLAHALSLPVADSKLWRIDAKKHFSVAADACAFMIRLQTDHFHYRCDVYPALDAVQPESAMGVSGGKLVASLDRYIPVAGLDGECPETWRSGVKHDLSTVMELRVDGEKLRNGHGEIVDVEVDYVYPLLKSSDLNSGAAAGRRRVLITQTCLQEDTTRLRNAAPKLWAYLDSHADAFTLRKSSVYKRRPSFSMFGVGDYTFAPFKVAISGLYKTPRFRLIGPVGGAPVVVDDTCYFLPFMERSEAVIVHSLLESRPAQDLLEALFFPDAKRPITKRLLSRLDLNAIAECLSPDELLPRAYESHFLNEDAEDLGSALEHLRLKWSRDMQLALVDSE